MIILGLTGSIGMGKSTAAGMLETLGVPVHDSDAAVHELMEDGNAGNTAVRAAFPYYSYPQIYGKKERLGRRINRAELGKIVFNDEEERKKLEGILHPLVRESQDQFIRKQKAMRRDIVVLDIPLLYETGADERVDYVLNVTAPYFIQHARVMSRPGMTIERFAAILETQMPDGEKSARADFVIHTGLGRAHTMKQLKQMLSRIRAGDKEEQQAPLKKGSWKRQVNL